MSATNSQPFPDNRPNWFKFEQDKRIVQLNSKNRTEKTTQSAGFREIAEIAERLRAQLGQILK